MKMYPVGTANALTSSESTTWNDWPPRMWSVWLCRFPMYRWKSASAVGGDYKHTDGCLRWPNARSVALRRVK